LRQNRHNKRLPGSLEGIVNSSAANFEAAHALKCEMASEVLRSSGKLRLRVTGWSMLPAVWPGDTLTVERAETETVSEGDIVLCARDGRFSAHRLVLKREADSAIFTRGDAMPKLDPPVATDDLLGKVTMIERNGNCIKPRPNLRFTERALAALIRHSHIAARVAVGLYTLRHKSGFQPEDRSQVRAEVSSLQIQS
jgi:signal peptidase I